MSTSNHQITLDNWPTREETAAILNISPRTVDRHAEAGRLTYQARQRAGARPERVFNPESVQALKPAPPSALVPRDAPDPTSKQIALRRDIESIPPRMAELAETAPPLKIELKPAPSRPLWCTLDLASEITGLTKSLLRTLIKHGKIRSIRDGSTKVWARDLDAMDPAMFPFAPLPADNLPET